jgi:membrane protein implicated in regulation of membrane protease activity
MLEPFLRQAWVLWTVAALIFLMAEMVIPSFACIFLAGAAALSAIAAAVHCNQWFQLAIFVISSLVSLLVFRPKLVRVSLKSPGLTNRIDDLVGEQAIVTYGILHAGEVGRVLVKGQDWAAQSSSLFSIDDTVEITGSDGIHLIVRKLK